MLWLLSSRAGQRPVTAPNYRANTLSDGPRLEMSWELLLVCPWCWSCHHFGLLSIPGMDNKMIIISHQREDGRFVTSIQRSPVLR